jgi:hypothetical protein
MSAIKIPQSIANDPPMPIPVAPNVPDAISANPLPSYPFKIRHVPKPKPEKKPKTGVFFAAVLARVLGITWPVITFISALMKAGETNTLKPCFAMYSEVCSNKEF